MPDTPDGDLDSLRWAIDLANANAEADTIELTEGTYNLTDTSLGDLDLTDTAHKITITGAVVGETIINASALSDRVFDIASGATVEIQRVTITGGTGAYLSGAGIMNAGSLTLRNSIVSGNSSTYRQGGGIYSTGDLALLENTRVSGNTAGSGGGIYSTGTLTLNASEVSGNSAGGAPESTTRASSHSMKAKCPETQGGITAAASGTAARST